MTVQNACEKCEVLRQLKPKTRELLVSNGILRQYKKGEFIFQEREEVTRIYFTVSGDVALYRINHDHDRKVIFVYGSGAMLNEVILEKPITSIGCQALKSVTVLSFPRKKLLEIMEQDFELTQRIMNSCTKKIRRLYRQLGNTTHMVPLEKQVASKLWKLGRDFGVKKDGITQIDFDMSITFLADMVGAKRESVSRAVKKLSERGLISCKNGTFAVYDVEALEKFVKMEKSELKEL